MKTFILLLLLSNIAFAVFQWWVPYEQLLTPGPAPAVAEQLQLLNEVEPAPVVAIDPPLLQTPESSPSTAESFINVTLCYTLGPFKQQSVMQEAVREFRRNGVEIDSRSSIEKEYMGMMVFINNHPTREQAVATAEALLAKGVREYIIVNEPGKTNALSLGVFGLKKNAEQHQRRISALGYRVQTEARYRNRTIYWLDYTQLESQNLNPLVDGLRQSLGVSRITRQCA